VAQLTAKRLELVKEAVPSLTRAAVLINPDNGLRQSVLHGTAATANALNIELHSFEVRQPAELEHTFAAMEDQKIGAIVVHEDTMLNASSKAIADLAVNKRMPSSGFPEFVRADGLIAYGINFPDTDYRAATFIDKILKGAKPGDLPVERSTKFTVSVNLKTANALGLVLPTTILLRADEVIE
jgi:putative ABC transport system substrate-binding protein